VVGDDLRTARFALGRRHLLTSVDVFGFVPGVGAAGAVRVRNVSSEHISRWDVVYGYDSRAVESGALGGEFVDVGAEFVVRSERE